MGAAGLRSHVVGAAASPALRFCCRTSHLPKTSFPLCHLIVKRPPRHTDGAHPDSRASCYSLKHSRSCLWHVPVPSPAPLESGGPAFKMHWPSTHFRKCPSFHCTVHSFLGCSGVWLLPTNSVLDLVRPLTVICEYSTWGDVACLPNQVESSFPGRTWCDATYISQTSNKYSRNK